MCLVKPWPSTISQMSMDKILSLEEICEVSILQAVVGDLCA